MNLFADESVDAVIVARLRSDGHAVQHVAEMAPGLSDDRVLEHAREAQSILLTSDKDFGELVFRLRQITAGVVLIRLSGIPARSKAGIVAEAVKRHGTEMQRAFTVVSVSGIRIHQDA